jgi:hexosaminidase
VFDGPFPLALSAEGVTVSARLVLPGGRSGPVRTARFRRATLRAAVAAPDALEPGLEYRYHEREFIVAKQVADFLPDRRGVVASVQLRGDEGAERFGVRLGGWLRVPADAVYEFGLTSDDGSVLRIGPETVIDHDGPHGPEEKRGAVALAAGYHPFELLYYQAGGGKDLALRVRREQEAWAAVPAEWLYRRR